jgi:hypothetical protein
MKTTSIRQRIIAIICSPYTLLLMCAVPTLAWLAANNKYGYAYYNSFAGNVYGRYDQDHLFTAVSRAFEWLRKHELTDTSRHYVVGSISFGLGGYQASKQYPNITIKSIDELHYTSNNCDYAILHTKCINYETLKKWWQPHGAIHAEYISGIPVCVVIKKNPHGAHGVQLLLSGQADSALGYLLDIYDSAPHTIDLWYWIGRAYFDLGDYEHAIAFFTKDASMKSMQAVYGGDVPVLQSESLMYIGMARMHQSRYEDAAAAFAAIEFAYKRKRLAMPADAAANCGLCYYYLHQYQRALPYLEAAQEQFPQLTAIIQTCRNY